MRMRKFIYIFFLRANHTVWLAYKETLDVHSNICWYFLHLLLLFLKTVFYVLYLNNVTVFSASTDQVLSNDSVATATENASRLGYKHVCVNYLHVASHDYQEVIQHTHTHIHTLTESFYFFLAQLPPLFQHKFKWRMKVPNIIESKT